MILKEKIQKSEKESTRIKQRRNIKMRGSLRQNDIKRKNTKVKKGKYKNWTKKKYQNMK